MFDEDPLGRTAIADDREAIEKMATLFDEQLRGRKVIAADGAAIGEVAALLIDTSKWAVVAVQIKLNKAAAEQLGASGGLLRAPTLELAVRLIQSVGDAVLLSVPTLELRQSLAEGVER